MLPVAVMLVTPVENDWNSAPAVQVSVDVPDDSEKPLPDVIDRSRPEATVAASFDENVTAPPCSEKNWPASSCASVAAVKLVAPEDTDLRLAPELYVTEP